MLNIFFCLFSFFFFKFLRQNSLTRELKIRVVGFMLKSYSQISKWWLYHMLYIVYIVVLLYFAYCFGDSALSPASPKRNHI